MVGESLHEIRARLDALATPDGDYRVACARTGERPFPVGDCRFPDRATAEEAARVATEYRAALRRYDPRTPQYDLVVHDGHPTPVDAPADASATDVCRDVTGALFEALAEHGHRDAERAVMDAYLDAAEATTDLDDLSHVLLRTAARALDAHLAPDEQVTVLRTTADGLPTGDALTTLAAAGLLDRVERRPNGRPAREDTLGTDAGTATKEYLVTPADPDPETGRTLGDDAGTATIHLSVGALSRHPGSNVAVTRNGADLRVRVGDVEPSGVLWLPVR